MISSLESETLPTAADVEAAAQRIADKAVETPLLESPPSTSGWAGASS